MITSNTFNGNDQARAKRRDCGIKGGFVVTNISSAGLAETKRRATSGAGQWLRVKAPVYRVFIVLAAFGTQRKIGHAGVRAIIRQSFN